MKIIITESQYKLLTEDLDDKWKRDDVEVTLRQLLNITKDVPVKSIPTDLLKDKVLDWDNDPAEMEKVEKSDLQYPVLIIVNDEFKIEYILDGNHRVQKSIKHGIPNVDVKLIKLSDLPNDFQFVLEV